ncbi:helix-turn-helix transcriptional regulator [Comamonas avium]|uniref:Helix-turn-helix transcriptional regulator n=1 Tax=Comamonas avium TaxID=2762231 RepID=A0ABR8SD85_9BURK|nr:AraC family transcriptional regulator [Comamonas avium]MBD7961064.1 helix-turn-helix transcriptional regulator [Comamonas avium]
MTAHLPLSARSQPRWMRLGTLRACDFNGPDYQFLDIRPAAQDALLAGHLQSLQVHPGILLHGVEARDLRTLNTCSPAEPGLHIVVVLEGSVDVSFGEQALKMEVATTGSRPVQACGAIIHTRPGDLFRRRWKQGKFERKISLSLEPAWLADLCQTDKAAPQLLRTWIASQQLAIQQWQPSPRAIAVAEQIIQLARDGTSPLLLLSRTLELTHEALQSLASIARPSVHALGVREHQRLARLKQLLDSGDDAWRSLGELAQEVGLSTSALQRQFRQIYGSSIDDYRRAQRLDHARHMLEQTGCSVLEVAHTAGYTSAANFSTAFKRRFGMSPKLVRGKV